MDPLLIEGIALLSILVNLCVVTAIVESGALHPTPGAKPAWIKRSRTYPRHLLSAP